MFELVREVREALAKATPGPWYWRNTQYPMLLGGRSKLVMSFERMGMQGAQPMFRDEHNIMQPGGKANLNDFADAHLIAHAHEWLAALCEQVERLRELVGGDRLVEQATILARGSELTVQEAIDAFKSMRDQHWRDRAEEAEAAVERVRQLLAEHPGSAWDSGIKLQFALKAALEGE